MATVEQPRATLDDLAEIEGKAELIGGKVVDLMSSGFTPSLVAFAIAQLIAQWVATVGRGFAFGDGMGFVVRELTSGRESFCPDAAYYDGPRPAKHMKFLEKAPTFAVEVRSENDYGPAAEIAMAAKRADYFEAGTLVVWDVDAEAEIVRVFRAEDPENPAVYRRGQEAEAEPALPGWRVAVGRIFG